MKQSISFTDQELNKLLSELDKRLQRKQHNGPKGVKGEKPSSQNKDDQILLKEYLSK